MRNSSINNGDKIGVDSQNVGVDGLTVAELRRRLKARPEVKRDVVMRNENTELEAQLALKEVINAVPTLKCCLSTVKDREASGDFDRESFDSFHTLVQLISGVIHINGMPNWMIKELRTLSNICEAASSIHLSQGRYDRDKIDIQITTIEDFAKVLTHDYEIRMRSKANGMVDGRSLPARKVVNGPPSATQQEAKDTDARDGYALCDEVMTTVVPDDTLFAGVWNKIDFPTPVPITTKLRHPISSALLPLHIRRKHTHGRPRDAGGRASHRDDNGYQLDWEYRESGSTGICHAGSLDRFDVSPMNINAGPWRIYTRFTEVSDE
ncbi:hypothetical protein V496_01637 [Pseudogymnoascus sp. VKM F-4515 (FW-2607)]|nr:hypothetical protein V496_01637 [Pseudogymnoascus sp. VKM F-4515 (FW-2607)]